MVDYINLVVWEGVFGAEMVAANTDAKHLLTVKAHRKVLLGMLNKVVVKLWLIT